MTPEDLAVVRVALRMGIATVEVRNAAGQVLAEMHQKDSDDSLTFVGIATGTGESHSAYIEGRPLLAELVQKPICAGEHLILYVDLT